MKLPKGFQVIKTTFALRNYRLYVIGNMTSTTGLWVQRVAIGWLTWELTESTAWLGFIVAAESIPSLLLGLFAGALVDRMDTLKLLRVAQALSLAYSIMLMVATFAGIMDIWLLFFLTIFRGCVLSVSRPSRMTLVFALVGRELLASALATNSMIFNISRFIGPALGGAIIAAAGGSHWGVAWAFVTASAMLLVMTVVLQVMKFPHVPPPLTTPRRSMVAETVDGVRYVVAHPSIRTLLFLLVCVALFAKSVIDLFPGFAAQVFNHEADGLGLLLSCHGLGAMSGGAWLASRSGGLKGMTQVLTVNLLFIALALLLFAVSEIFWLGCIMVYLTGAAFIIMSVGTQTLIQANVDSQLRGRVVSVYGMIAQDMPAVGAMLIGGLAEFLGLQLPVSMGAGVCFALWWWAGRQKLRLAAALESEAATDKSRKA